MKQKKTESTPITVSVILPVYNVAPWIGECIDSLKKQKLPGLEFIFVDDCSTDDSLKAVEAWAKEDDRVRILRNERNTGSGPSRNVGIEAARGAYLSFIDPDDYISDGFYESLYSNVSPLRHPDIIKGCVNKFYDDTEKGRILWKDNRQNERIQKANKIRVPIFRLFTYEHWSALYKSSLFADGIARYGSSITAQDTTFLLKACFRAKSIVIEEQATYYYRQRSGSATSASALRHTYGELDALDEKIDFLLEHGFDKDAQKYIIHQAKTLCKRFQDVLGRGLINHSECDKIAYRLAAAIKRTPDHEEILSQSPQLASIVRNPFLFDESENPESNRIRISVILPFYNPGDGLTQCIYSLRQQMMGGLEFIFVDDCSTDGSIAQVETWANEDSRVTILRNQENIGAGPSRNKGIEAARGEYLSFIDPDDYVSRDFYEVLYTRAYNNGFCDIVKASVVIAEKESGTAHPSLSHCNKRITNRDPKNPLYLTFNIEHWSAIYKRSLFVNEEVRYGHSRVGEDSSFLMRICRIANDIIIESNAKYTYVKRPGSAMRSNTIQRLFYQLDSLDEQFPFLEKAYEDKFAKMIVIRRCEYCISSYYSVQDAPDIAGHLGDYRKRFLDTIHRIPEQNAIIEDSASVKAFMDQGITLPAARYLHMCSGNKAVEDWLIFLAKQWDDAMYYNRFMAEDLLPRYIQLIKQGREPLKTATLKKAFKALPVTLKCKALHRIIQDLTVRKIINHLKMYLENKHNESF